MNIENLKAALAEQGHSATSPGYARINPRDVVEVAAMVELPDSRIAALAKGAAGALAGIPDGAEPPKTYQLARELHHLIEAAGG